MKKYRYLIFLLFGMGFYFSGFSLIQSVALVPFGGFITELLNKEHG